VSGPSRDRSLAIVIAGGGTGGHLFPGIALADALARRGAAVTFVGTATGIEVRAVPAAGYPLELIPGAQVRGGGVARVVRGLGATAAGVARARRLLRTLRPDLVVGVGGYASFATVAAARLGGIPIVLLEQNTVPGVASRTLGRIATRICLGFAEAAPFFPTGRSLHTGNPVRAAILATPPASRPTLGLLVFGGSQGARHVSDAVLDAVARLGDRLRGVRIRHQTGTADRERVAAAYARLGVPAVVEPFITDMGTAYAEADLVIARAGAMSCAEITARGLPSILVPYPHAADDHQRHNAEALVRAGAATMILDPDLTGDTLVRALDPLLADAGARARMAAAARVAGRPDAAERVADVCEALVAHAAP
jgi:UDP-N-acetylglucosamine--N-acetylmuramyl-(pentapeptide) pyrophosphoryl-undecaprenol N-acetylglucosamine transferase